MQDKLRLRNMLQKVNRKITFLAILALAVIFLVEGCDLSSHPSDQALEQTLRSKQSNFNRLIDMLNEDSDIVRLTDDNVFLKEGSNRNISKERLSQYQHLFKELNLQAGIHRDGECTVRLIASSKGIMSKSEKSYVYSCIELAPLVKSLDDTIKADNGDHKPVYMKLFGNWYLYYESW